VPAYFFLQTEARSYSSHKLSCRNRKMRINITTWHLLRCGPWHSKQKNYVDSRRYFINIEITASFASEQGRYVTGWQSTWNIFKKDKTCHNSRSTERLFEEFLESLSVKVHLLLYLPLKTCRATFESSDSGIHRDLCEINATVDQLVTKRSCKPPTDNNNYSHLNIHSLWIFIILYAYDPSYFSYYSPV
jgi:hypothetical protein